MPQSSFIAQNGITRYSGLSWKHIQHKSKSKKRRRRNKEKKKDEELLKNV